MARTLEREGHRRRPASGEAVELVQPVGLDARPTSNCQFPRFVAFEPQVVFSDRQCAFAACQPRRDR